LLLGLFIQFFVLTLILPVARAFFSQHSRQSSPKLSTAVSFPTNLI
jgi:hypothetical protein